MRQRVLGALRGEKVDRIPWIPLCSRRFFLSLPEYARKFPCTWWEADEGLSDDLREEELKFRVDFYRNIGADFMQWGGSAAGVRRNLKVRRERNGDAFQVICKTPVGELEESFAFAEEAQTVYRKSFLLKSEKDFAAYKHILDNTEVSENSASCRRQLQVIGEDGVIFADGIPPAIHNYVNDLLGIENLALTLANGNKEFLQLLEIQERINTRLAKILSESPFEVFLHQATWDIGRISPNMYRQYYVPSFLTCNAMLHGKGKICLDHLSGQKMGPFLEAIEGADFDGIYGFVFPPVDGDLPLPQLARRWKERKIVPMGGLDPGFLALSKPSEVRDRTKRLLQEVGDNPFILGTADDVVYGTPVRNLEAVSAMLGNI